MDDFVSQKNACLRNTPAQSGEWPQKAREALIELCVSEENEENIAVKLLSDIRRVFDEQGADRSSTLELVKALIALDTENPWAMWWEKDVALS